MTAPKTSPTPTLPESVEQVSTTRPPPVPDGEVFDHTAKREEDAENRQEALLDEAIEETFPCSDPISPKHIT